ncbi:MAG: hypothetical protein ACK4Z9_07830 [Thermodesulfovibrionales bacterium]
MYVVILTTVAGLLLACGVAMVEYKRDISYAPFSPVNLKVPTGEMKKAETPYMIAFVNPTYEASTVEARKSIQNQIEALKRSYGDRFGGLAPSGIYRRMDKAQIEYVDRIKEVFQADLEQILLAKNIRVLGTFKSRDEMTFDEKKRAIYTFTPEIRIDIKTSYTVTNRANPYIEKGEVIISGGIILVLRESITGEKIWVKRIDAPEARKPYEFVAKYKEPLRYEQTVGVVGVPLSGGPAGEKDNTDQVLASALSEFYTATGDKLWRHIDPEEWSKYLKQAESLREEKRY